YRAERRRGRRGAERGRPAQPGRCRATRVVGRRPAVLRRGGHQPPLGAGARAGVTAARGGQGLWQGPPPPRQGTSAGQQCGLGMILLANSARPKAVVNVPYCLTPPNVLPFFICPNSQTQAPLTLACVQ